jgi:Asp-tRNA(Asn)/Glu-tRNA(Gln) amidotransferase C subunit
MSREGDEEGVGTDPGPGTAGGAVSDEAPTAGARVRHLAKLARLRLDDAEAEELGRDLEALLQLVDRLPAPVPEDCEAADEAERADAPALPEADDLVEPGLPRPVFLAEAPSTDGELLWVPAVRPSAARSRAAAAPVDEAAPADGDRREENAVREDAG